MAAMEEMRKPLLVKIFFIVERSPFVGVLIFQVLSGSIKDGISG